MGHFLLTMVLLVFSFNSFASHIVMDGDYKEKKRSLTKNDVEILDFEIIEVNEKMVDEDLLEHYGGNREKTNLNNLSYWYVHAPAPLRLFILLLGNGEGVHPLAGSIFNELLAYREFDSLEKAAVQKDAKKFFDLALGKLLLSFFREKQQSKCPPPSMQELISLDKDKEKLKELEVRKGELDSTLAKKEEALRHIKGEPLKGQIILIESISASAQRNQRGLKEIIERLKDDAMEVGKKIKELKEKIQPINDKLTLAREQEGLLSANQSVETTFMMEPEKLETHLKNQFSALKKKAVSEDSQALNLTGLCYFWGWGCEQDAQLAYTCFLKAIHLDKYPKAYENMGLLLEGGLGVTANFMAAFEAYNNFTFQEYTKFLIDQSNGYLHLAHCHHAGNEMEDLETCIGFLKLAVEHKNPIALRALTQLATSSRTYPDFSKMMEEFDERVNDSLRKVEYSKLSERINKGDLDAYHSFGKYFLGERPCNYFQVALSFAIGYLEENANFLKFIEPVLFSENPIHEVSLYHQDDLRLRAFKKFIKNFNISILVGKIMDERSFKDLERIVKIELSQAEKDDKMLEFVENDGLRYPSFQSVYHRACDGSQQYRRLLGYYYLFGLEQDADIKKSALLFSLADSPLPHLTWKKKIDDFLNPTMQEEKSQISTSLEHEENCDKLDSKDLPASFEWYAELAGLGYPIGFYEMAKMVKDFSPSLARKYLLQAGQHPKVTSELSTIKRDIPGVKA